MKTLNGRSVNAHCVTVVSVCYLLALSLVPGCSPGRDLLTPTNSPAYSASAKTVLKPETAQLFRELGVTEDTDTTMSITRTGALNIASIRKLLKQGAEVNGKNRHGFTPLMVTMEAEDKEAAELLIKQGADVNFKGRFGATPLIVAAEEGVPVIVRLLLENGADTEDRDRAGMTALMLAAHFNKIENVKLLVQHGADLNKRDNAGKTVLYYARALKGTSAPAYLYLKTAGAKE